MTETAIGSAVGFVRTFALTFIGAGAALTTPMTVIRTIDLRNARRADFGEEEATRTIASVIVAGVLKPAPAHGIDKPSKYPRL